MKPVWVLLLFAGLALPPAAQADRTRSWTTYPLIVQGSPRSRMRMQLSPQRLSSDHLMVYPSTEPQDGGQSWRVDLKGNKGTLATRGKGGYYWVQAREEGQDILRTAATMHYFSSPGPAPRTMLTVTKGELEIRPLHLPREHRHYRANEQWPFQILYQGKPLTDAKVELQTQQGTTQTLITDAQGQIQVIFPDDFPVADESAHQGHNRRRRAGFVLAATVNEGRRKILSTFNYHYTPGAYANKSLWLGVGFALLGMAAASPLLRRRTTSKKEATT